MGNGSAVLVSVDSNGDNIADATVPELAWSSIVPQQVFSAFPAQVVVAGARP